MKKRSVRIVAENSGGLRKMERCGRWLTLLLAATMLVAAACSSRDVPDPSTRTSHQALTAAAARVLSFEDGPNDWSNSSGALSLSDACTDGNHSLAVSVNGWTEVTSIALSTIGAVGDTASIDVQLPAETPYWGEVRLIVRLPSLGEYYRELGSQSLVGLPAGSFQTLTFALPSDLGDKLAQAYDDLTFTVAINAPGGQYLVDRLSLGVPDGETGTGGGTGAGGAPSAGDQYELSLEVPLGSALHQLVLGATRSLRIADGVLVTSSDATRTPDVSSTGSDETNIGADAELGGTVWSVGPVKLRDRAVVAGDVVTESEFRHDNEWTVAGAGVEGDVLTPATRYAWTVEFPPATTPISLEPGQQQAPNPGAFTSVSIKQNATLSLSSGTYTVDSVIADSGSHIQLDAAAGPVFLYVRDTLIFRGDVQGADPGEFFVGYVGTAVADIDSPFQGTVVAPNAHVRLSPVDGTGREGSFFGRTIEADAHNPLVFTPFAHWDMIIPPEIIVECLTRSAAEYGAGMFGYVNRLDIPVEIPEGPRNSLSDTRLHKGPLESFVPGEHHNLYAIPFRGDALDWALSGNVVRVDNNVQRCTFDNYQVVDVGVPEPLKPLPQGLASLAVTFAPSPPLVSAVEPQSVTDVNNALSAVLKGAGGATAKAPSTGLSGGFNLLITTVGFDEEDSCLVGNTDVDLVVKSYRDTQYYESEEIEVYEKGWSITDLIDEFIGFPGLGDLFDHKVKDVNHTIFVPVYDDQPQATVRMDLYERDAGLCGDDDRYTRIDLEIDPDTFAIQYSVTGKDPKWYAVMPTADILPPEGDPSQYLFCARGRPGWGVCFQILEVAPPRLCAGFPAQFLDSDGGEDDLATRNVQQVPASFAAVGLSIVGAEEPFEPLAFAVLDEEGCLPDEYMPSLAQLTPAGSDFLATFTWRGSLIAPLSDTESITIQIDRVPGASASDTWASCGATGDPFVCVPTANGQCTSTSGSTYNACDDYPDPCPPGGGTACYLPAANAHVFAVDSWSMEENRAVFGTSDPSTPTVFSNSGAIAAHVLQLQFAQGNDLGIGAGKVHLWPEALPAFFSKSPYHSGGLGDGTERYVLARPSWTSLEADGSILGHESDTNRKFTLVHELTHAMQHMGAGSVGNGSYAFRSTNPNGTTTTSMDPEGFPVECRCNHIGNEFLPWHCMNSIEPVGGASGEGYAHAMAARAFNNPSDPNEDCWFMYVKDVLVPPNEDGTCPGGSLDPDHPDCIQVGSPEGDTLVTERYPLADDQSRLRNQLAGWYFVTAPARVRCSEASKWRNHYCASQISAALAGMTPSAVEYLGTELDWLQFFWGLTRGQDAWTPTQFLALQRAACAQRICPAVEWSTECEPQRCTASPAITNEPWRLYDELATAQRPESAPVTPAQWDLLVLRGDQYGVSTDLQP